MARIALDFDDSDLELSTDDETRTPPPPQHIFSPTKSLRASQTNKSSPAAASLKRSRSRSFSDEEYESEDEDEDEDDGPPRAPGSEDEDEDAAYDPRPVPLRRRERLSSGSEGDDTREQERVEDDEEDEDDSDDVAPALLGRPAVNRLGWPTDLLGAEPGRRELMQATLFAKPARAQPAQEPAKSALFAFDALPEASTSQPRPAPRPPREYAPVSTDRSITQSHEGAFVDAGLSLARSFRASFGPANQLIRIDNLRAPRDPVVIVTTPRSLADSTETAIERSRHTLQVQLDHTSIVTGPDGVPEAVTEPSLRFHHFDDDSVEADVWRLGTALFDDIELGLADDDDEEDGFEAARIRDHVERLRRRALLSDWLERTVKSSVSRDLADVGADAVFARLSGHQLELACDAALAHGDIRLASLLAQAGGDLEFRRDIRLQLDKWREYRVDAHVSVQHRRVYEMLAGNVTIAPGTTSGTDEVDAAPTIRIAEGLDWKRAFGLHLWYGAAIDAPLGSVIEQYLSAVGEGLAASPRPGYVERAETGPKWTSPMSEPDDPLFELIRLSCDLTRSLETALVRRGFGPSPLDSRLAWHVYCVLARAIGCRDFVDLPDPLETEAMALPHRPASATADQMTVSYAHELASLGLVHWAAFVLLHLPAPDSRTKAIKTLLAAHAADLTDSTRTFLTDTLAIPASWIHTALALHAQSEYRIWDAMQHLLAASDHDGAHRLIIAHLAPECVVREDIRLLRELLEPLSSATTSGWASGGQVFLDYADCVSTLRSWLRDERGEGDGSERRTERGDTLASLIGTVLPRAIDGASERLHATISRSDGGSMINRACYSAVLSALSRVQSAIAPHLDTSVAPPALDALQGGDRLDLLLAGANQFAASLRA